MKKLIVIAFLTACTTLEIKPKPTPSEPVQTTPKPSSFYPCNEDAFWWAVMQAESGGNSRHVYKESWGENSVGLYQLSPSDSTRYKDCPNSEEALMNAELNTKCKDSIARTLIAKYPNQHWSTVLGKYWSTLRAPAQWPDARTDPYKNFKYFAAKKGCVL